MPARIEVDPDDARYLVDTFRAWAGKGADLRVLFTPDVLVAVDNETARGFYYDDGWTTEAWIEQGVDRFLTLLQVEIGDRPQTVERPEQADAQIQLTVLALDSGHPIKDVLHLI